MLTFSKNSSTLLSLMRANGRSLMCHGRLWQVSGIVTWINPLAQASVCQWQWLPLAFIYLILCLYRLYLPALINFASWFAMSRIRDTWWHGHISGHLRTSQDSHRVSLCVSRCVMLCLPLSEPGLTQREVISWRRDKGLGTRPKSKPCPEAKCNASTLHIFHILHKHPKP